MSLRRSIRSAALLVAVLAIAGALAAWKYASMQEAQAAAAHQPEPLEAVMAATASERDYVQHTTAIGTVRALRSILLMNEVAGTVHELALVPGAVVDEGTVLVALDVAVEEAELAAHQAEARRAESFLERVLRASAERAAAEMEVDRVRAERDVALAEVARIEALIARKTIRAPFRARVGMSDVHVGQYLDVATELTTLQGVDDSVHVDFTVSQDVATELRPGRRVEVQAAEGAEPLAAEVVALDARVEVSTRNLMVRARIDGVGGALVPGASVRVRVPIREPRRVVTVPVSALRRAPSGDHVFVLAPDAEGRMRAHARRVVSGPVLGDDVVLLDGLATGEQIATSGSFKLRDGVLVAVQEEQDPEQELAGQ